MGHFSFCRKGKVSSTAGHNVGVGGAFPKRGCCRRPRRLACDLRVEVDDDLDHLEPEEAVRLARKLKGLWLKNAGI